MSSGQKILADLLELTNAATKSIVEPKSELKDKVTSFSSKGNNVKATDKKILQNTEKTDAKYKIGEGEAVLQMKQHKLLQQENSVSCSSESCLTEISSHLSELVFDPSRSIKVDVPKQLPKDRTDVMNSSSDSSNSSKTEIAAQSTPHPSDNLKAGVFVSSNHAAITEKAMEASFTKSNPIASKCLITSTDKVSSGLIQGDYKNQVFTKNSDEVMAVSYPEGQKKNVLQEKFKARMLNAGPVKKRVMPRIIQSSTSNSQNNEPNEISANDRGPKHDENHVMQSATESASIPLSYASIATSAAIAPFLQIQNALESQISSLVNSISLAHSAKEQIEKQNREKNLENFEQQLVDGFDKRISRMEELQAEALQYQLSLGAKIRDQDLGKPRFISRELDSHASASTFPTKPTAAVGDLQMIPTRDNEPIIDKFRLHEPAKVATTNQRNCIAISNNAEQSRYPPYQNEHSHLKPGVRPFHSDKSTSPFMEQILMKNKNTKKTQTSSAESSILSEESLLDTPLPRSKIPVPFSRYTPKGDKRRRIGEKLGAKRVISRIARNVSEASRQAKNSANAEKENLDPGKYSTNYSSSDRRYCRLNARDTDRKAKDSDNGKLEVIKDGMEDLQKETLNIKEQLKSLASKPLSKLTKPDDLLFKKDVAPIDNYLVYPIRGHVPDTNKLSIIEKESTRKKRDSAIVNNAHKTGGHHIQASRILEEIKQSRSRLENNLESVLRHRDQSRMYDFIDHHQLSDGNQDLQRIRLDVDKRIEEIANQVKQELHAVGKEPAQEIARKDLNTKKETRKDRSKVKTRSLQSRQTTAAAAKSKTKTGSKDKAKKKVEVEPVKEMDAKSLYRLLKPSQIDEELLARVYGSPMSQSHRSTIRPIHVQSRTPLEKSEANATGYYTDQAARKQRIDGALEKTFTADNPTDQYKSSHRDRKAKYYFQPSVPGIVNEDAEWLYPSSGDLVPVAVSLGKPRQDSNLRLPVPAEEEKIDKKSINLEKRSNVAVLDILSKDVQESKEKETTKKPRNLAIQNLPNVNIETPIAETPKNRFLIEKIHRSSPNEESIPPKQEDYASFQNYIATKDIDEEEESNVANKTDENLGIQFHGIDDAEPKVYDEPPFPPQRPRCESEPATLEIQSRLTLEEKAQEWIEQELLARIISQMNVSKDPTLVVPADASMNSEASASSDEDDHNWIHDLIGPSGLQLFVDSGIPINNKIVEELIRDVITERLKILLGHPKQQITEETQEVAPEEPASPPSIVSTPLQTPVYTPVPSEAASIYTPMASSVSPESSEESIISVREEKSKTENEVFNDQSQPSMMTTPPQTPKIQRRFSPVDHDLATPVSSLKEDENEIEMSLAHTPEESLVNETLKTQSEFERSGTIIETEDDKSPEMTPSPPVPLQTPPKPILNVIHKSPSPKTSSFTVSSNSTVGSSLFEGISDGEHLCPDSVIPGLYSEGEFPVSEGQAMLSPVNEIDEDVKANFKELLQNAMGKSGKMKLNGEVLSDTATLEDTEDIEEDTLEEVSISEGELLAEENPVVKLLNQIKSPPNSQAVKRDTHYTQEKSEGEVSFGQDIAQKSSKDSYFQRLTVNGTRELKRKDLSSGDLTSLSNNGGKIPSYSVGEIRNLSIGDFGQSSKAESHQILVQEIDESDNNDVFKTRFTAGETDYESETMKRENLESQSDKSDSEAADASEVQFAAGKEVSNARAILVQSRDFDNTSTFNFTDSLNETKLATLKDFDLGTLNEQQIEEAIESPNDGSEILNWNQATGDEKMPTKITLMIPSVADEDSADEITLEGDVNSSENETRFSY